MISGDGVERYEEVVELRALVASAAGLLRSDSHVHPLLERVQRDLVDVARDVLLPEAYVGAERVAWVQTACEDARHALAPDARLQGSSEASIWLLLGCAAARKVAGSARADSTRRPVNPFALDYLEELTELLFVLARTVGVDPTTRPRRGPRPTRGRVAAYLRLPTAPVAA